MKRLLMMALVLGAMFAPAARAIAQQYETFDKNERKQAEKGDPKAEWDLGQWYLKDHYHENVWDKVSDGVSHEKPKPSEAAKWLHRAADHGYVDANGEIALGSMYMDQGNYAEASFWFHRAADHGNAMAVERIGDLYSLGHGVEKNPNEAMSWYSKASAAGYRATSPAEMYAVGNAFLGAGSSSAAVSWLTAAAQQNNVEAMELLGEIYRDGIGIPANPALAQGWFNVRQQILNQQAQEAAAEKQAADEQRRENREAVFGAIVTGLQNANQTLNPSGTTIQDAANQQQANINAALQQQLEAQQAAQARAAAVQAQQNGDASGHNPDCPTAAELAANPKLACLAR
jgi:TPR repeat protein